MNYKNVNDFIKNTSCHSEKDFPSKHCVNCDCLNDEGKVGRIQRSLRGHDHNLNSSIIKKKQASVIVENGNGHAALVEYQRNWNKFNVRCHAMLNEFIKLARKTKKVSTIKCQK